MTTVTEKALLASISEISEDFFKLSMELAEISERKAYKWLELRKESKTNAEADMTWDATADGRREAYLKHYLKGLSALRSARILEFRANSGQL